MCRVNVTVDTYNKAARAYADKFDTIGSRRTDIERAFALRNKGSECSVVEWGCGNGRDAQVILEFTSRFIGIDASAAMIALAKESLPDADLRVADIRAFEIPQDTDIIIAFASLLHLNKEAVTVILSETHPRMAQEGIVYISLKRAGYEERIVTDEHGPRVFYFYERKDIEEMIRGLYEVIWYEEQLLKGVEWLTVALRKNDK